MTAGPAGPMPIRPRPAAGEAPAAYVRRLAVANHMRPGHLRRYLRPPDGDADSIRLDWLAVLVGRSLPALERTLAKPDGRRPRNRYTRQADKPALFASIRADACDGRLSIEALADKHGVNRYMIGQALASPWPAPRKKKKHRLDPFKPVIEEMVQEELAHPETLPGAAKRIYKRLTTEHAMTLSSGTFYRHVAGRLPANAKRRPSRLDPFKPVIEEMVQEELAHPETLPGAGKRIFKRLTTEHAMTGVPSSTFYHYLAGRLPANAKRRPSRLDPFKPVIEEMVQEELAHPETLPGAAKRIYKRLATEHAMTLSTQTLNRYLAGCLPARRAHSDVGPAGEGQGGYTMDTPGRSRD